MAHAYHTKVPYRAIMRYILHYTDPGDIVLDGFCGTGMTGVAAHMCGPPEMSFKALIDAYTGIEGNPGIGIVFGTDGYGIYGTTTRSEIELAAQMLDLTKAQIRRIRQTEKRRA